MRLTWQRTWCVLCLLAGLLAAGAGWAQQPLPVPPLNGRVIDQTATLAAPEREHLTQRLAEFERRKGTQIVLLLLPTTAPEDIAAYGYRVADAWKIGRAEVGDGIVVLVAKDDRRMRIEVAKALEGAVPDLAAARIVDQAMAPRFRQNDFAGGLNAALDQLFARIDGEALPPVADGAPEAGARWSDGGGPNWLWMVFGVAAFAGPLLRRWFGVASGLAFSAGGAAALVFLVTSSWVFAVIAGMVALMFTLLAGAWRGPNLRGAGRSSGGTVWPGGGSPGGSWGSGRGGGMRGGGVGFRSGGGGNFGGGGASGGW